MIDEAESASISSANISNLFPLVMMRLLANRRLRAATT